MLKYRLAAAAALLCIVGVTPSVNASPVYPSCDQPNSTGHVWYVDPLHGGEKGDGSKARPWHTLAEVINDNLIATAPSRWDNTLRRNVMTSSNAPIKPGDTIYLMTGNHGATLIQGYFGTTLTGYANKSFITIMAGPGQVPVIPQLVIKGGSHFIFRGISFTALNTNGSYAASGTNGLDYTLVNIMGPHDNIVFDSNTFLSQGDVSGWSISDWISKRVSGLQEVGGTCIAVTNNTFKYIGFGLRSQKSQNVLISGNTIDYFADDGIDYGSDDVTIENNTITNSIEDGDGFHRDGMQGQPYNQQTTLHNVVIRNNKVIRIADPNLPFPGSLQGIDAFDGMWDTVTIDHNVIITNASEGLTYFGIQNATITNNVVMGDSGKVLPCYNLNLAQCLGVGLVPSGHVAPALRIGKSKTRIPSSNVTIADNIVSGMGVDLSTVPVTIRNNLCLQTQGKCVMGIPVDGTMKWIGKVGVVGDDNLISSMPPAKVFGTFDTSTASYSTNIQMDPRQ